MPGRCKLLIASGLAGVLGAALAGCQPAAATRIAATTIPAAAPATRTPRPPATETADSANLATPTPSATPPPAAIGPELYPAGVNPLTGLPVADPAVLERAPLLIMVSNESPEVRPQSGLMAADHVWEYQMEGFRQTRYTAVIYSQTPERVGSVRSVRLINTEHLRPAYDGLLVISGASAGVYRLMLDSPWWDRVFREEEEQDHLVRIRDIPRPNTDFYHALFAIPAELWRYADERGVNARPSLQGLTFAGAAPPGGIPTREMVIDFPEDGPIHRWAYDPDIGRWLSFTTDQKAMMEETPDHDLLAGQQLAFDNVVLISVPHYLAPIIEDQRGNLSSVGVRLIGYGDAVLLRDGQRYPVRWWRSQDGMIRLRDADHRPVPLKPGTTWFVTASSNMFTPEVRFRP